MTSPLPLAVLQKLRSESSDPDSSIKKFCSATAGQSITTARKLATELHGGEPVLWDCDAAKTPEGLYRTTGGIESAIARALAYAPYADLVWLETKKPDLEQARKFARRIKEKFPGK
jgi:isocitrate lyase